MPEKSEIVTKPGRPEAKLRKKESEEPAVDREAALVLAASQFKALGDPTRLRIINFLSSPHLLPTPAANEDSESTGDVGRTVGDVSAGVFGKTKVSSTLSHHLKELRNAGLIAMKRRGKNLICRIQPDAIEALRCYLPDPFTIPVTTKAQHAAPKVENTEESADMVVNGTDKTAPVRTLVRKAAVRKKKLTEGRPSLDSENQTDDARTV